MDDFGTGYSSLSYLQSFPFEKIEVDRSFVADLETNNDNAAIVRAVITLANSFNLPVLAEGVEIRNTAPNSKPRGLRPNSGLFDPKATADLRLRSYC